MDHPKSPWFTILTWANFDCPGVLETDKSKQDHTWTTSFPRKNNGARMKDQSEDVMTGYRDRAGTPGHRFGGRDTGPVPLGLPPLMPRPGWR